jgi:hypothetical protein
VFTLGSATSKRLSPRGSYYPGSYHRRKIAAGFATLIIAVVLGAYLTAVAYHNKPGQPPTQENQLLVFLPLPLPINTATAVRRVVRG